MNKTILLIAAAFIVLLQMDKIHAQAFSAEQKQEMMNKVKAACQFSWDGYKKYAWGYDALKPISKKGQNWYKQSLLLTPMDAFDTFILMDMKDAASESKQLVLSKLNFNIDQEVQVFEITIRLLASLETAYELDSNKQFLALAKDLGNRLMPAFRSPTGMPFRYVNLKTGKTRDSLNNPAEIGTLMLEFGKLSQLTGDTTYYHAAKKALMQVYSRRSGINLVGTQIDVMTGEWKDTDSHVSAMIDSYYEYLYKAGLLFRDPDFRKAWEFSNNAVKKYLLRMQTTGWYLGHADMNTGKETYPYYGALDAFYAGLLALSGDVATASKIQDANYYMWTHFNMEPELFDFKKDTILYASYPLRPENLESCFYLYKITKNDKYLWMGKRIVDDILNNCKTEAGYASIKNVKTLEQYDSMESFFFAETLKYAYLLFAPDDVVDLNKIVFTTEAHPLRKE